MRALGNLFGSDYDVPAGVSSEGVPDVPTPDGFHEESGVTESSAALLGGESGVAALLGMGAAPLIEGGEGSG